MKGGEQRPEGQPVFGVISDFEEPVLDIPMDGTFMPEEDDEDLAEFWAYLAKRHEELEAIEQAKNIDK